MKRFFSSTDLRKLIIPLIIDQFLQAFVGLADSIMVASVGEAAVSGVSLIDELPPHTRDFSRELDGFTCTIKVRMV